MTRREATFEIESRDDAEAVRRLLERLYDTLREESREVHSGDGAQSDALGEFEAIRDAVREPAPGSLTVSYESREEPFEE